MAALIAIGFFVYGPIMIIGLHALDLVPKKAAGTAAGFTGFFGYVFGSAIAGTGVGWIADHWGWGGVFGTMIVCCVLTMAFSALTLRHRSASSVFPCLRSSLPAPVSPSRSRRAPSWSPTAAPAATCRNTP
jgi:sugar phosphate permease